MNEPIDIDLQGIETSETPLNHQVHLLRSRVEAEFEMPAVVMVTSALDGDGKSLTAHSLASSLMKSGHRAALVSLTGRGKEVGEGTTAELSREDGSVIGRDRLATFVQEMRVKYDFTIVDAGTFLSSNAAMALAHSVDGVLLTVRIGRAPSDEDQLTIRTIEQSGGRVVGIVAADADTIARFERLRPGERVAGRERLRLSEAKHARSYALPAESLAQ
jgi:Mrp family chromosome partitioning ATPase